MSRHTNAITTAQELQASRNTRKRQPRVVSERERAAMERYEAIRQQWIAGGHFPAIVLERMAKAQASK